MASHRDTPETGSRFEARAAGKRSSFAGELWGFLRQNKKWWMLPMIAVIVVMGALVLLGGSPLAPFIYTLF